MTISIGELQKNISLLKKIKEPIIVVDKRTNKKIAKIEPIEEKDDMKLLEKILEGLEPQDKVATREDFERVYEEHLREKYGFN
ncbi:hypothetical protein [Nautilia sp.]